MQVLYTLEMEGLRESGTMILKQLATGPMMNFVYVIGCRKTREAAVVDPAWNVPAIIKSAGDADLVIRHILLTHAHPERIKAWPSWTPSEWRIAMRDTDYFRTTAALQWFPARRSLRVSYGPACMAHYAEIGL